MNLILVNRLNINVLAKFVVHSSQDMAEYLFKSVKYNDFIAENDKKINHAIDHYNDKQVLSISVDDEIKLLYRKYEIRPLFLKKENTRHSVRTDSVAGENLPSGTPFVFGKRYDIDVVSYKVPFTGNSVLFYIKRNENRLNAYPLRVDVDSITIELTEWGPLMGNDDTIEKIKNEFIGIVKIIEENLEQLNTELNTYNLTIPEKIRTVLNNRIDTVKVKNVTHDKLKPF